MVVSVAPDRLLLERIVSARQVAVHAPGDYGREEDYSATGPYEPRVSNDIFEDFDPGCVNATAVGPPSGDPEAEPLASLDPMVEGNIENIRNSENVDGNGHDNGNRLHEANSQAGEEPRQPLDSPGPAVPAPTETAAADSEQVAFPQQPPVETLAEVQQEPQPQASIETQPEALAETQPEVLAETQSEALAETQPEALAETQPEALAETQPEALAETQPEALAETQPETLAETQPEALAETQPEALAETQPEALAETQPEALAETQPEAVAETQPEAEVEAPQASEPLPQNFEPPVPVPLAVADPVVALASQQVSPVAYDVNAPPGQEVARNDGPPPPMTNGAYEKQPQVQNNTVIAANFADADSPTDSTTQAHQVAPEESQLPPQKPKVAALDFFDTAPNTKPKMVVGDSLDSEDLPRPRPLPQGDHAFDFFASSGSSAPKKSSDARQQHSSDNDPKDQDRHRSEATAARSDVSETLSSFESLLAKQSKSGSNKVPSTEKSRDRSSGEKDDDHEGLDQAETSKSTRPAALKQSSGDDGDDDDAHKGRNQDQDHDDDDNEEKDTPKRRNFSAAGPRSGEGSLKAQPDKSGGRGARSRRDNDDNHGEAQSAKLRAKFQTGGLVIAGFPISFGQLGLAIGITGLLFCAVSASMTHGSANISQPQGDGPGGSGMSDQAPIPQMLTGTAPSVGGIWAIEIEDRGQNIDGQMTLQQDGSNISGSGYDRVGRFSLTGYLGDGNNIFFQKRFIDQYNRESGPPASFVGSLDLYKIPMQAGGQWELIKSSGIQSSYNKMRSEVLRGQWRAMMSKSNTGPGSTVVRNTPHPPPWGGTKPMDIFTWIFNFGIYVALLIGVLAIASSFVLFGPSGLINIWNKQQYIPSQFKSQHGRMRGQLARTVTRGSLPLGQRVEWKWYFPMPWVAKDLALPPDMRKINPHMLILGQGGKGKTRLIAGMIAHDIESNDRAVVCIDSDGTLIDLVTRWIAAHPKGVELTKRVILIDPTFKGEAPAFNPLEMPERGDIQSVATSIVYGFKAIYREPPGSQSQWNAQTADILRNSVLLLMANDKTLLDLPALLQDNDFRDIMLETVERRKAERVEFLTLLEQWGRYKKLARTDQWITWVEPILNRLNPMLSNPRIRAILTEPNSDLKLNDVIVGKKILLVKVPQGEFGQDANLLGSLIVAGIKQAALTLSSVAPKTQQEVALYLDNFDNFIEKETVDNITSETKKFKIGLIGVTKSMQQLPEDFRNQLIISIGTLVTFALSKKDGDLLGPQMFPIDGRKVKHQTMSNLFNRVNTSPQFELVVDEEKLNIDKIVRQEERTFFCYRMGAEAGLFNLKAHPFEDIPNSRVRKRLLQKMHLSSSKKSDNVES
jgi:hypothetical protein